VYEDQLLKWRRRARRRSARNAAGAQEVEGAISAPALEELRAIVLAAPLWLLLQLLLRSSSGSSLTPPVLLPIYTHSLYAPCSS
jgi:hypothetical protein